MTVGSSQGSFYAEQEHEKNKVIRAISNIKDGMSHKDDKTDVKFSIPSTLIAGDI